MDRPMSSPPYNRVDGASSVAKVPTLFMFDVEKGIVKKWWVSEAIESLTFFCTRLSFIYNLAPGLGSTLAEISFDCSMGSMRFKIPSSG